jgi:hypothetical protein
MAPTWVLGLLLVVVGPGSASSSRSGSWPDRTRLALVVKEKPLPEEMIDVAAGTADVAEY